MTDSPDFTVSVDQNPYLAAGATQVDAIVTVTATGDVAGPRPAGDALEVIIVDCSGSMHGDKIASARRATSVAIKQIRDGVSFAVIAGTHHAALLYPTGGGTAVASPTTRAEAIGMMSRLRADGGTAIGAWLALAGQLAEQHPGPLRHAILLTDGQNGERPEDLAWYLDSVLGRFVCDCRGVGADWKVDELRQIASALLGSVDIVADPADLAADFRAIMASAMDKRMAEVALRLWTPRTAAIRFVKQVAPTVEDLTGRRTEIAPQRGDYPLGSWGAESRDYHVCVDVQPGALGDEMLAARVTLVAAGSDDALGQGLVRAVWTEDTALATGISRGVAHYTGQAELAAAIQEGLAARKAGDQVTATTQLGRAVALATASGNGDTARLLERVVDVVDAPSGTVRLRADVADLDEMTLDTRSTKTVRVRTDAGSERS
jgi:hypothetical protein